MNNFVVCILADMANGDASRDLRDEVSSGDEEDCNGDTRHGDDDHQDVNFKISA